MTEQDKYSQSDRQMERNTERPTGSGKADTDRQIRVSQRDRQMDRQSRARQRDRWTDTDRQTNRRTDGDTVKQMERNIFLLRLLLLHS